MIRSTIFLLISFTLTIQQLPFFQQGGSYNKALDEGAFAYSLKPYQKMDSLGQRQYDQYS